MGQSRDISSGYGTLIETRLLRYFVAVAELGHLTRAAERLGIRQPPLSQQIRLLERQLGVTLFQRQPRGMALTESGTAFLAEARGILQRMDEAVAHVRGIAAGERGRIAIGFTGSILHWLTFGPDPMSDKGMEGVDSFQQDRAARIDRKSVV